MNLGRFVNKDDAIKTYQNKSKEIFGEFTFPINNLNLKEVKQNGKHNTAKLDRRRSRKT